MFYIHKKLFSSTVIAVSALSFYATDALAGDREGDEGKLQRSVSVSPEGSADVRHGHTRRSSLSPASSAARSYNAPFVFEGLDQVLQSLEDAMGAMAPLRAYLLALQSSQTGQASDSLPAETEPTERRLALADPQEALEETDGVTSGEGPTSPSNGQERDDSTSPTVVEAPVEPEAEAASPVAEAEAASPVAPVAPTEEPGEPALPRADASVATGPVDPSSPQE